MDYQQLLVDNLELVDRLVHFVARRHHLSPADAEEFASLVHLRLVDRDYAVLRKFQHRSSLSTYLTTVIERLYLDECNARYGKWRPSALARRLGPAALELERLIARDGHPPDEAIEMLRANRHVDIPVDELRAMAAQLPQRASRHFSGEEDLASVAAEGNGGEGALLAAEDGSLADRVEAALKAALEELHPRDQVLLQLRFVQMLRVADMARVLKEDQKRLYRRLDHLMQVMRRQLEAQGIDREHVDRLVGHPEAVVGGVLKDKGAEFSPSRPSKR